MVIKEIKSYTYDDMLRIHTPSQQGDTAFNKCVRSPDVHLLLQMQAFHKQSIFVSVKWALTNLRKTQRSRLG